MSTRNIQRVLLALYFVLVGVLQGVSDDFPLQENSVRFAIIGDMGTGGKPQYEVAEQMLRQRAILPFVFVLMLGDNIYGGHSQADLKRKFADPYQPLMDQQVQFYASLGNHDNPNERSYEPFHMGGKRYYSFKKGKAEFFALDSNYMDPEQLDWIRRQLSDSTAAWKICFFHHPLYSDAKFHGPDADLRQRLEPILEQGGADVVFSGHEHVYERLKPQHGIYYFVLGNSGELRMHDLRVSPQTAKGFDTDRCFGMFEIAGEQMYFRVVSRTGETVDSGVLPKIKDRAQGS
ncbi:MAG: metallophosphoesterase [Acidobacteriota bacterium]